MFELYEHHIKNCEGQAGGRDRLAPVTGTPDAKRARTIEAEQDDAVGYGMLSLVDMLGIATSDVGSSGKGSGS